jgi:dUTP pyrophosphatase
MISVRIHTAPGSRLPVKSTTGAAALDIHACLPPDIPSVTLRAGRRTDIPTGLYMEIPQGYFVSLRPRSGLALKNGITLLNSPATIDCDYRGEIRVIMINLGEEDFIINHGDRICQMLLEKSQDFQWQEVERISDLDPTHRGEGGFGSTGTSGTQFA